MPNLPGFMDEKAQMTRTSLEDPGMLCSPKKWSVRIRYRPHGFSKQQHLQGTVHQLLIFPEEDRCIVSSWSRRFGRPPQVGTNLRLGGQGNEPDPVLRWNPKDPRSTGWASAIPVNGGPGVGL